MWDKKKPDNSVPQVNNRPAPQPIAVPPPAAPAPQAQAFRPPEAGSKGTAIGSAVSIVGDVYSEEDLFVDGEIKGTLQIANSRLTIGPNGKAKSNIRAREVIIQGQVQGDVEASQKITIRKNGSLVGNIKTTGIVIDDDAYFKGSIDIVRKEAEAMSA
jgi:cytoskeletal protein CcmA (bactofilin family)